jgi:hypothetical protein
MPQGEGPSREQNRRRRLPHHRSRDVRRRFRQRNSARPAPSGRVAPVELGRKGSRDPDTQWREWGSQSPPPRSGRALSRLLCGMALARSPSVSRTTRWGRRPREELTAPTRPAHGRRLSCFPRLQTSSTWRKTRGSFAPVSSATRSFRPSRTAASAFPSPRSHGGDGCACAGRGWAEPRSAAPMGPSRRRAWFAVFGAPADRRLAHRGGHGGDRFGRDVARGASALFTRRRRRGLPA